MTISINNVVFSTNIFIAIFLMANLAMIGKQKNQQFFSEAVSRELKGLAILAIVFAHIGYYLSSDTRFLFPLSILAGVGVNLFLFLSGFGLTMSSLRKNLTVMQFYQRRLLKLFIPMWVVLAILYIMDHFILGKSYSSTYIGGSILGLFLHANLYEDVNSPLWYFTFILFYYLIYPLVFRKNNYWISAFIVYVLSFVFVKYAPPGLFFNVAYLYGMHLLAFPLGIISAGVVFNRERYGWAKREIKKKLDNRIVRYAIIAILLYVANHFSFHSDVGQGPAKEELVSLIVLAAIVGIFLIKRIDLKLFSIFGLYSYEIYLMHWPIMYRYDVFYGSVPGWLATILYLILFLILGRILQKSAENLRLFFASFLTRVSGKKNIIEK